MIERARSLGQKELIERGTKWLEWYEALDGWEDATKTTQSLKEHLRLLNSAQYLRHGLGRTGWYNRNLRIFSNLLRVRTASSDRILVIMGAGHIPLLLQMAQNAPEFESVSVLSVLGQR